MKLFSLKRIVCLVLLVNLFCLQNSKVKAQSSDISNDSEYGLWTELDFKKEITKKLDLSFGGEFRTKDKISSVARFTANVGLSYDVFSFLKASFDYKYIYKKKSSEITNKNNYIPSYWSPRHRFLFSLKGEYEWRNFEFSLRERYQYTYSESLSVDKYDGETGEQKNDEYMGSESDNVFRSRLKVDWNIKDVRYTPFVSYEFFNYASDLELKKTRFKLGTEYKLNKHHSFDFYYCFQNDMNYSDKNIIGVSYKIKF